MITVKMVTKGGRMCESTWRRPWRCAVKPGQKSMAAEVTALKNAGATHIYLAILRQTLPLQALQRP